MAIHIEDYRPEWKLYFERLNKAWLEEYFFVEPVDKWVLENPDEAILSKGGKILFALDDDMVIGTVALRRIEPGTYEMTKMAVDKAQQGKGAGILLCKAAITTATEHGANMLLLYSNSRLTTAIAIYRKLGFLEVEMEQGVYERADIKMEMRLRAETFSSGA